MRKKAQKCQLKAVLSRGIAAGSRNALFSNKNKSHPNRSNFSPKGNSSFRKINFYEREYLVSR
jgi:hypothetical protein